MAEAKRWDHIKKAIGEEGINPLEHLYFIAYFDEEGLKKPNQ